MPPQRNPATGPNAVELGDVEDHAFHPEPVDIPIQGAVHPDSTQLLVAAYALVTTMTQEREARQPLVVQGCTLKNFCSHNFDGFDGTSDHISVKNWLNDVEELLEAMGCNASQKVPYTAYKLSGEAKRWWQAKKMLFILELGLEQAITWEMFKDAFNKHLFPRVVQETKAREFMDLTQGGMSVTEYASLFVQLS
jgi:hypothetical protein